MVTQRILVAFVQALRDAAPDALPLIAVTGMAGVALVLARVPRTHAAWVALPLAPIAANIVSMPRDGGWWPTRARAEISLHVVALVLSLVSAIAVGLRIPAGAAPPWRRRLGLAAALALVGSAVLLLGVPWPFVAQPMVVAVVLFGLVTRGREGAPLRAALVALGAALAAEGMRTYIALFWLGREQVGGGWRIIDTELVQDRMLLGGLALAVAAGVLVARSLAVRPLPHGAVASAMGLGVLLAPAGIGIAELQAASRAHHMAWHQPALPEIPADTTQLTRSRAVHTVLDPHCAPPPDADACEWMAYALDASQACVSDEDCWSPVGSPICTPGIVLNRDADPVCARNWIQASKERCPRDPGPAEGDLTWCIPMAGFTCKVGRCEWQTEPTGRGWRIEASITRSTAHPLRLPQSPKSYFEACLLTALAQDRRATDARVEATLSMGLDRGDIVGTPRVGLTDLEDTDLASCLGEAAAMWRFPTDAPEQIEVILDLEAVRK